MNRLVSALLRRPDVVAAAAEQQGATFDWLVGNLGEELLDAREKSAIEADPALSSELSASYLPAITAEEWNRSVDRARSRPSDQPSEWVTMIPAAGAQEGLTAPEDDSNANKISLFIGPVENARTISIELTGQSVAVSTSAHCSLPVRGNCDTSRCRGCTLIHVEAPHAGLICRCEHEGSL
jgi:hypothetical protein